MAKKTDYELLVEAGVIKNEETPLANTAERVGAMLEDIIDSKLNASYKVYSAIFNQSGGDGTFFLTFEDYTNLTIGKTYTIANNDGGADWTNVGASNNDVGTQFVATGGEPNSWGEGALQFDNGPVVTILENTIGNIVWDRQDDENGIYYGYLDNGFGGVIPTIIGKMAFEGTLDFAEQWNTCYGVRKDNDNYIQLQTGVPGTGRFDGLLFNQYIEIRMYI